MSPQVSFVVSRHQGDDGWHYRVQMESGEMRIMSATELSATANGSSAIDDFDPDEQFQRRPPPRNVQEGPSKNDIVRVELQGAWHVCTVLKVNDDNTYRVRYDDGMLVEDYLSVPWNFVQVSMRPEEVAAAEFAAAPGLLALAAAAPMSEKALGKQPMHPRLSPPPPPRAPSPPSAELCAKFSRVFREIDEYNALVDALV